MNEKATIDGATNWLSTKYLTDPPAGTVNRLPGRVTLKRYLGALTRYDFQVDGCDTVWLGDARQVPEHAIAVAPEHVRLLDN